MKNIIHKKRKRRTLVNRSHITDTYNLFIALGVVLAWAFVSSFVTEHSSFETSVSCCIYKL
jgi:hypothetical protein